MSGSQNEVPGPAASASPGKWSEPEKSQHQPPNLLNQNLQQWDPEICIITSILGDSDAFLKLEKCGSSLFAVKMLGGDALS